MLGLWFGISPNHRLARRVSLAALRYWVPAYEGVSVCGSVRLALPVLLLLFSDQRAGAIADKYLAPLSAVMPTALSVDWFNLFRWRIKAVW